MVKRKTKPKVIREKSQKKTVRKASSIRQSVSTVTLVKNKTSHWAVFKNLKKKTDQAWAKLRTDVKRKAAPNVLIRDRNNLLLLLGECNYLVREYTKQKHKM